MLLVIIGIILLLCGAVVCGYGYAIKQYKGTNSNTANGGIRPTEAEQRVDSAVTAATEAGQSIQDIIEDIRRSPINDSGSGGNS